MKNTTQKGKEAENIACEFLQNRGFVVLERNFFTPYGEIDIIAKDKEVLYFVEVKSGIGFEPVFNITKQKLGHLTKSMDYYLQKKRLSLPYCLSALILSKAQENEDYQIQWLENLTLF
ncbi:YraN family protein [Helicobacter mesocricetorum]|uniref:YraN family protein n=1 Tax=Helicobacter mesocricetorum TaxID=87012 RepID=UPI000CF07EDE|nr:YraN family protein [Helicobacter mesocricetorum]